ncbi:nuclear transport factor 2 family protein [Cohnella sp. CFH 77786]|uniref:nuclear transport factor 2 family protein n=1 Tax=Cohnella sp. CFH 77786 TaxID=2662265 RepID=UPI001C60FA9F|nr:nuclear transport factor 2 family protein [Cohnella sp. CFH 77786]MBW5448095.1 nuclear transport factor 2 family protein [Cohnella sp. CFH 77786]
MKDIEITTLIRNYLNAYNSFDIDGMIRLLHENIEFRNISGGVVDTETKGIDQFRTLAEQSVKIFSQRRQTITEITIHNDTAEIEVDYVGTLATDLPNGLKAGDVIQLKGKSVFRIKNEKLIMIEDYS